jgi:hypothetical protein
MSRIGLIALIMMFVAGCDLLDDPTVVRVEMRSSNGSTDSLVPLETSLYHYVDNLGSGLID